MMELEGLNCGCWACTAEWTAKEEANGRVFGFIDHPFNRMIVCKQCGNKRCPHANDHRNICTGSNEPGQKGSAYE